MRVLQAANGRVLGLTFSPDGTALAAAVEDQGVYLWNLTAPGGPVRLDDHATDRSGDLYFSPDGNEVGWLGWDGWKVYDRETRVKTRQRLTAAGHLYRLIPAPTADRVYSQHNFPESEVVGWHRAGDRWVRDCEIPTDQLAVEDVTVAPDGRRLAMLTRKTVGKRWWEHPFRLELRSAVSGVVETTGEYPYNYRCSKLAFAPDGMQLVGVHEMTLLVWPVPALGDPLLVRNDSRKHFTAAAYHPSGRYLFAASNDATVHVYDTAGWGRLARFSWNLGWLRAVAASPDGMLAAAGNDRGEVVVWDVDF